MTDDPARARPEPWWSRAPASADAPDVEASGDADRAPSVEAPVPWLGQTEPFLRALQRSLEPLEERQARIANALRAGHLELTRLTQETQDGLLAVTAALSEVRAAVSSSADEVRARAEAAAGLAREAEQRLGTLLRELTERVGTLDARLAALEAQPAESARLPAPPGETGE